MLEEIVNLQSIQVQTAKDTLLPNSKQDFRRIRVSQNILQLL